MGCCVAFVGLGPCLVLLLLVACCVLPSVGQARRPWLDPGVSLQLFVNGALLTVLMRVVAQVCSLFEQGVHRLDAADQG